VALDAAGLGPNLKWEESRGGDRFPHLYGSLDPAACSRMDPLPWTGSAHDFPSDIA
jgi:uncharacterized protein (DUF952 family)